MIKTLTTKNSTRPVSATRHMHYSSSLPCLMFVCFMSLFFVAVCFVCFCPYLVFVSASLCMFVFLLVLCLFVSFIFLFYVAVCFVCVFLPVLCLFLSYFCSLFPFVCVCLCLFLSYSACLCMSCFLCFFNVCLASSFSCFLPSLLLSSAASSAADAVLFSFPFSRDLFFHIYLRSFFPSMCVAFSCLLVALPVGLCCCSFLVVPILVFMSVCLCLYSYVFVLCISVYNFFVFYNVSSFLPLFGMTQ